jgi:hypothetical protein
VGAVLSELIVDGNSETPIDGLSIGRFRQTLGDSNDAAVNPVATHLSDAGSD